jgi:hypothetical protein
MLEKVTVLPPVMSICKVDDGPNGGGKFPLPVMVAGPEMRKPLGIAVTVPPTSVM